MKRILSMLAALAGLTAGAAAAHATGRFLRSDGIVFDSDVGAACGALHTDVLFESWSSAVDMLDEPVLDGLASCMTSGALAGVRVAVIGIGDDRFLAPSGAELARERMSAVMSYLMARGVDARQLEPWAFAVAWDGGEPNPDRVMFRILEGMPLPLSAQR
jgi:outer membrane protein OmpA-like peptidoglycan-associated protein